MIEYEENIDLKNIEKYMIKTFLEDRKEEENIKENKENRENKFIKKNNNEYFSKYNNKYNGKINKELKAHNKKMDKYFWYFYNIKNDIDEEDNNKMFSIEKEYKINFVTIVRENKNKLKSYKLKLSELEDEFANNNFISLKGLYALCIINKINLLVYYENNTYNKLYFDEKENVTNIAFIDKKKNIEDKTLDKELYDDIINNYYYIENINKPINSLSYYKLDELQRIGEKLCINLYDSGTKLRNKKELYQDIINKLII
tara:strand:+ start:329 stop:1102 length:774 start_codon:yes stop_codon:yes gene_type:complete